MHTHEGMGNGFETSVTLLVLVLLLVYPVSAWKTNNHYRRWPIHRYVFWGSGILSAGAALVGPVADWAHMNFAGHMTGHLLLGMLAPLLLVFAKPVTLLLRTLPVQAARRVTGVLNSQPLRLLTHPMTATVLNIGGLYLLYTTGLYPMMHQSTALYALIHLHVFLAGYLFTSALIYIDLTPHRYSHVYRAGILILALAGHKILSKYLYAHPPGGVGKAEAEQGAMLMYYGGDVVDLALIIILCYHWYEATAPRLQASETLEMRKD
ncbi:MULTISPECIES: cytochrome c oxidase assembly protein [unclassified Exiguobacterium]|uniref:cytochrome c oxidase assembly protein n=1 Tax=unclassified Exiguobacterium TaxID=2644629 RepID=UPI001BE97004|nr:MULTISPECIES: cytochrome c oxidase assembly protein [unclassified Exiguobacterium]